MYPSDFKWPDGAAIAVVFNMSWEMWQPKTLGTAVNIQRHGETVPAGSQYGRNMMYVYQHAFAETGGMQRLLGMWKRYGIKTSCYTSGLCLELFPSLAKRADADGHELLVLVVHRETSGVLDHQNIRAAPCGGVYDRQEQ